MVVNLPGEASRLPDEQTLHTKEMLERELPGGLTRKSLHVGVVGSKVMNVEIERTTFGSFRMTVPAGVAGNDQEIVAAITKQRQVAAATVAGLEPSKLNMVRDVVARVVERADSAHRDLSIPGT